MGEQYGFKTEFRGFARADVLKYIDELRLELQTEQENHRAEVEALRAELSEAQAQLADAPQAAKREEELRAALAESEATVERVRTRVSELRGEMEALRASINPDREKELEEALAETRDEAFALREREAELTAQLAQTHNAVARLWNEKEVAERKLATALTFVTDLQAHAMNVKQTLSDDTPSEDGASGKPMERWLF